MKKTCILAAMLMAFITIGHAQEKIDMRLVEKVLHPRTIRNSIAPEQANYLRYDDGVATLFRDDFTYDENDYYLANVITFVKNQGEWLSYYKKEYDYDYNLMPTEIVQQKWDNDWVNDQRINITYTDDDFIPKVAEEVYQQWENGSWTNVRKLIYNYEPDIMILVKEWNGSSFENSYLYTFESEVHHTSILLQYYQGGAWQNQDKWEVSYNTNEEVTEQIAQTWENFTWNNVEKTSYYYDGPYKLRKVTKTLWENNAWTDSKTKTIEYTYDWMGNSARATCQSNYGDTNEQNTDIEMFYNEGESITYDMVNEVSIKYIDVTGINDNTGHKGFSIHPNPAHGIITIETEHAPSLQDQTYRIANITGQTVMTGTGLRIDVSTLPAGLYFLTLGKTTKKLIVE